MNISIGLVKALAAAGDHIAEKVYDTCVKLKQKYNIYVSWANDGIGYIIVLTPKPEAIEAETEEQFFNEPRYSLMPMTA